MYHRSARLWRLVVVVLVIVFSPAAFAITDQSYRGLSYTRSTTGEIVVFGGGDVNTLTGNLVLRRDLFFIPARSIPVHLYLTYNADHRLISSPFGYGWNLSYNIRFTKDGAGNVTVVWGDGRQDTFTLEGSAYRPPPGVHLILKEAGGVLTLTTKQGLRLVFAEAIHRKLTRIEDPDGNALTLGYDSGYGLATFTDASGRRFDLIYNPDGLLEKVADPNLGPRVWTLGYDANGRLTTLIDPLGNAESFVYDDDNQITATTDRRGNKTTISYATPAWHSGTRLVQTIGKGGSSLGFAFDQTQLATTFTNANNNAWKHRYDAKGQLASVEDPAGKSLVLKWDVSDNLTGLTDRNGNATTFTYDGVGNLLSRTDALGNTAAWTYTAAFNRVDTYTNPGGHAWSHEYDTTGNRIKSTDPSGKVQSYTYDAKGQPLTMTDPNANTWQFANDAHGNLSSVTDPLGNMIQLGYDADSRLTALTDANGAKTEYAYDALGRLTGISNALSKSDARGYDAAGNLTAYTDRNGSQTTFAYNALGRLLAVTDPLGNADARTYDSNGNLVAYTDRTGKTTEYAYDALDRLTTRTDPPVQAWPDVLKYVRPVTGYAYDADGNVTQFTDPGGNAWVLAYDAVNRLTRRTDPLNNERLYAYDVNGNLAKATDALGQATQYGYDSLGRLISQTFADTTTAAFTYDANGNLLTARDSNSDYAYSYDALGRPIVFTDNALGKSVQYSYDTAGRLATLTGPEGDPITYNYDAAGRLVKRVTPPGTTTFAYDANGNLVSEVHPNAVTSNYAYDAANLITRITHKDPLGTLLASFAYTRDAKGRITRSKLENGSYNEFSYDALGRLTRDAEVSDFLGDGTPLWSYEFYTYNLAGHKAQYTQGAGSGQITWDATGRPVADSGWGAQGVAFTHDADGNRLQMKEKADFGLTRNYTYDSRGRMTRVATSGWLADQYSYTYDVFNRLIRVEQGASGVTQRILYDRRYPIAEYDASGKATAKWFNSDAWFAYFQDNASSYALITVVNTGSSNTTVTFQAHDESGTSSPNWSFNPSCGAEFHFLSPTFARKTQIIITTDNPGNATGQDQTYFPLFGDLYNPVGSRVMADTKGAKAGDLPHNSRGEAVNRTDNLYPEAGYTPTLEAFWHSWPGEYNASWPALGRIDAGGLVQDHWIGANVTSPSPLGGVTVSLAGPSCSSSTTPASGQLSFTGRYSTYSVSVTIGEHRVKPVATNKGGYSMVTTAGDVQVDAWIFFRNARDLPGYTGSFVAK